MSGSYAYSRVIPELSALTESSPAHLGTAFRRLVSAVWDDGRHTDRAVSAVPELVAAARSLPRDRQGHVILLLGLLAESTGPEQETVRASVGNGLGTYLGLLAGGPPTDPLASALLYLLANLPAERERVILAARGAGLERGDLSRLERCLRPFDPADPAISRCWPSPAAWAGLTEADREADRRWIAELPPARIRASWDRDTRSLLAYSGAKALWAVEHGPVDDSRWPELNLPAREPLPPNGDPFRGHAAAFRCPACHGALVPGELAVACTDCGSSYPLTDGGLDFSAGVGDSTDMMTRNVPLGYSALRSAFLRLMGSGWDSAVPLSAEDDYLRSHVVPAPGPVLDLGAGTGRWTEVLTEAAGPEQVIALDVSRAMLGGLRSALPRVLAVRGDALAMPFADASLGAVNCWNTLQALPDRARAIAEVGRCLRPGGTLTLMTYQPTSDWLYGYFQGKGFGVVGVQLTAPAELHGWLREANLTVRDQWEPGTYLFVTAVR